MNKKSLKKSSYWLIEILTINKERRKTAQLIF